MYSLSHFLWKQTKWWRRLRNCKRRVTGWAAHILQATSWVRLFPFVIKSQEKRNSNCFYQLRVPERMMHHPELRQAATASTKACLSQYRVNGDLRAGDHLCLSSQLPFKQCFPSISWLAEHPHLCSNHKFPQDIRVEKVRKFVASLVHNWHLSCYCVHPARLILSAIPTKAVRRA